MNDMQHAAETPSIVRPPMKTKYDLTWWAKFDLLFAHKQAGGEVNLPFHHDVFGIWIAQQRQRFWKEKLLPERHAALTAIGVDLEKKRRFCKPTPPSQFPRGWREKLTALHGLEHAHKGGVNIVGTGVKSPLGQWFLNQLNAIEAGHLTPEQAELFRDITLRWDVKRGWYGPNRVEPTPLSIPALVAESSRPVVLPCKKPLKKNESLSRQPFPRPLFGGSLTPEARSWWSNFAKLEADWLKDVEPLLNPDRALQEWLQEQLKAAAAEGGLSTVRMKALRHIGLLA